MVPSAWMNDAFLIFRLLSHYNYFQEAWHLLMKRDIEPFRKLQPIINSSLLLAFQTPLAANNNKCTSVQGISGPNPSVSKSTRLQVLNFWSFRFSFINVRYVPYIIFKSTVISWRLLRQLVLYQTQPVHMQLAARFAPFIKSHPKRQIFESDMFILITLLKSGLCESNA